MNILRDKWPRGGRAAEECDEVALGAASRKRGERVTRKPRVVTFRLDQATWDLMRELVPYTRYRNTSSFIRAAHPYLPQSQTLRIIFATACQ